MSLLHQVTRAALVLTLCAFGCSSSDGSPDASTGSPGGQNASGSGGAGGAGSGGSGGSESGGSGGDGVVGGHGGSDSGGSGGSGAGAGGGDGDGGTIDAGGGCVVGGMLYEDGATGIPAEDGCNTCSCAGGALACTKIGCPSEPCVVARRLDTCCETYVAVSRAELLADDCLVAYPGTNVDPLVADACYPGAECAAVLCAPAPPPSRSAIMIGDACQFGDECLGQEGQCVIATDIGTCCPCPQSVPASIVESDPCLVAEGEEVPEGAKCPVCNTLIACEQCPAVGEASCAIRDSFSLCTAN